MEAPVYFNHGRWVVNCPSGDNNAFMIVGKNRNFICEVCGSEFSVRLPHNHMIIEKVLAQRPLPENRNWYPGETLADLIRENQENL